MFAVIESGGKQHKVKLGEQVKLEKIEQGIGEQITFDQVLMIHQQDQTHIGTPYLSGKTVTGEIVAQGRHKKVHIIKFRRRKHSMKKMGHRQYFTAVKILDIAGEKVSSTSKAQSVKAESENKQAAESASLANTGTIAKTDEKVSAEVAQSKAE